MSTIAEIEAAIDSLPPEQLQEVVRHAQARVNLLTARNLLYEDAHGRVGEDDIVAGADLAFLAYELDEKVGASLLPVQRGGGRLAQ